ncbi:hypothetical protein MASR1M12_13860 [Erysipelotrichia bacterium]
MVLRQSKVVAKVAVGAIIISVIIWPALAKIARSAAAGTEAMSSRQKTEKHESEASRVDVDRVAAK